ncbi:MAG: hypothetical protein AB7O88_05515 [Reyranellaceae bacterium]
MSSHCRRVDDAHAEALVERVIPLAHVPRGGHVALIGHNTLPLMLALLHHHCDAVCSVDPDAAACDSEPVDMAWIVAPAEANGLDKALRLARRRITPRGALVVGPFERTDAEVLSGVDSSARRHGFALEAADAETGLVVLCSRAPRVQTLAA